jgi:hypothetical protein
MAAAPSVVGMTAEVFIASIQQGGGPMISVLLAIALVGGIVYLVRSRTGSGRDREHHRSAEE